MCSLRLLIKTQIITVGFLLMSISSVYSQIDSGLYQTIIQDFQKEMPGFQKRAFKKFRLLYTEEPIRKKDYNKYQGYIVPSFKVDLRQQTDQKNLIYCVDFKRIWNSFECYYFKDNTYIGVLTYVKHRFNNPVLKSNFSPIYNRKMALQLKVFNPDMVFYPDVPILLCALKNSDLYYIDLLETLDYKFIPEKDFILNNASSYKKLNPTPFLKHYKKLK
jgi:hypothetical protein